MFNTCYYIVGEPTDRMFPHKTTFRINGNKQYEASMTSSTSFCIRDSNGRLVAECRAHAWYKSGSTMHFQDLDSPLTFAKKSTRHWTANHNNTKIDFDPFTKTQVYDELGLELECGADKIRAYARAVDSEILNPLTIIGLLYFIYKRQICAWA